MLSFLPLSLFIHLACQVSSRPLTDGVVPGPNFTGTGAEIKARTERDVFGIPLLDSLQLPRLIDSAVQVISSHWNLIAPVANTATSIINSFTSGGASNVRSSTIEPVPEAASSTTTPVVTSDVTPAEPLNGEPTPPATRSTRVPLKWRRTRPESISN